MALPNSNPSRQGTSLADFGQDVARRREIAGAFVMPRNSGQRRTESKVGLLAAIEDTGATW